MRFDTSLFLTPDVHYVNGVVAECKTAVLRLASDVIA